jgi:hypothetical protein
MVGEDAVRCALLLAAQSADAGGYGLHAGAGRRCASAGMPTL